MGGMLILLAVIAATLLWMDLSNRFVWIALGHTRGAWASWASPTTSSSSRNGAASGLTGRGKLIPQFLVAFAIGVGDRALGGPGYILDGRDVPVLSSASSSTSASSIFPSSRWSSSALPTPST